MTTKKEMVVKIVQAMISSGNAEAYFKKGKHGHGDISFHTAIAKEALKYANAIDKEYEQEIRK
ncbi:MAG TPA: hypothetical protein EYN67_20335 [Flavobacteriales bacterium]|nr:hypothetical protein [Methylococcaceae bacterium]HHZ97832.1 hypothetical protein [Flavobacteriales bacterium]